jgi:hypothetical protein
MGKHVSIQRRVKRMTWDSSSVQVHSSVNAGKRSYCVNRHSSFIVKISIIEGSKGRYMRSNLEDLEEEGIC